MTEPGTIPQAAVEVLRAIRDRRSVRHLEPDRQIPDQWVEMMMEAAILAPSAGNCQPWRFIAIRDQDLIKKLGEVSGGQIMFENASLVIAVIGLPQRSGARYGTRGTGFYYIQDTAAAVENMLLFIHSLGLGATWVGAFDEEAASVVLELDKNERPVALIPTGFPSRQVPPRPRRPASEVVSYR